MGWNIKNVDWRAKARPLFRFVIKLPPVLRSIAGVILILSGFLGIVMPILGFWMAPLGLLFIAADIPSLCKRVGKWLDEDDARAAARTSHAAAQRR